DSLHPLLEGLRSMEGAVRIFVEGAHDVEELGTGSDAVRDSSLFRIDGGEFAEGPSVGLFEVDSGTEELAGEQDVVGPAAGLVLRCVFGQFGAQEVCKAVEGFPSRLGMDSQLAGEGFCCGGGGGRGGASGGGGLRGEGV